MLVMLVLTRSGVSFDAEWRCFLSCLCSAFAHLCHGIRSGNIETPPRRCRCCLHRPCAELTIAAASRSTFGLALVSVVYELPCVFARGPSPRRVCHIWSERPCTWTDAALASQCRRCHRQQVGQKPTTEHRRIGERPRKHKTQAVELYQPISDDKRDIAQT